MEISHLKSFSNNNNITNESINNSINDIRLNISTNSRNNSIKKSLFTKSEKKFLSKIIPNQLLDNYENKFDSLQNENITNKMKENKKKTK